MLCYIAASQKCVIIPSVYSKDIKWLNHEHAFMAGHGWITVKNKLKELKDLCWVGL